MRAAKSGHPSKIITGSLRDLQFWCQHYRQELRP
jgi:hypothetical protein